MELLPEIVNFLNETSYYDNVKLNPKFKIFNTKHKTKQQLPKYPVIPSKSRVMPGEFVCCYCEIPLTYFNYTKEHIVPRSRGGSCKIFNIKPCCYECNQEKGNLMLHTYIQLLNLNLDFYSGNDLCKLQIKIRNANLIAQSVSH